MKEFNMEFRDKVKKVLEEIELPGLEVEIESEELGRVVAEVISPAFETMDEFDRQGLVWEKILERLDDQEQRRVEFVHTTAPSERAEASSE
jgi:acid stress-induced BolA-like protein IbaG/YrbA